MGRKPLSSATHKKNGSYVKNPQRENKSEPIPVAGTPKMPDTVAADPVAANKWKVVCKMLDDMDVLSTAEGDLLELFCINYSHYVHLLEQVNKTGFAQYVPEGLKRNPLAGELAKVTDRHAKLLSEMGLTPSSRTKIGRVEKQDKKSDFEKWTSRGSLN